MSDRRDQYQKALRALYIAVDEQVANDVNGMVRDYVSELEAERDRYRKALEEITKGEGVFSMDNYEFACNIIEAMKGLARTALQDNGEQ